MMTKLAPVDDPAYQTRPTRTPPNNSRAIEVPIDIHPDTILGDHTALSVPRRAFGTLYQSWTALKETAARVKDTDKLAKEARTHTNRVVSSLRREHEACLGACTHLSKKIDEAIQPNPHDPMGGEIRAYIRGAEHPFKAASDAALAGDRRMAAAVLNAPPQLSGLTHQQYNTLHEVARGQLEHADYSALKSLQSYAHKLDTYTKRFEQLANDRITAWETGDDDALKTLFAAPANG